MREYEGKQKVGNTDTTTQKEQVEQKLLRNEQRRQTRRPTKKKRPTRKGVSEKDVFYPLYGLRKRYGWDVGCTFGFCRIAYRNIGKSDLLSDIQHTNCICI